MGKIIDRTGQKFGKLTVIKLAPHIKSKSSGVVWECLCECGNITFQSGGHLQSGHTRSCGCLISESVISRCTKHGMCRTKEYDAWCGMKRRCYKSNPLHGHTYKEKGIKVCDEWLRDFQAFYNYIGPAPENDRKWSVGRIDNNDDYKPGNVRWEQDDTQARNHSRQKNNTSGFTGVYLRVFADGKSQWVAFWNDTEGKKQRKAFGVSRYGYEEAKKLAIDYRKKMLDQLQEVGIVYAESHGTRVGE